MSKKIIGGVGGSSKLIAAIRAAESDRPITERLYFDPFAREFSGDEGDFLAREMAYKGPLPPFPSLRQIVNVRTKWLDDTASLLVRGGDISQVVTLACGGDSRPYRLDFGDSITSFQVDLPQVIEYRNEIFKKFDKPKCRIVSLPTDLCDLVSTEKALLEAGFNKDSKTLWIAEGFFYWIPPLVTRSIVRFVSGMSSNGSAIIGDMLPDG